MKSKKLFAILTLIAFMMTLVPALAFAEESFPYNIDATASSFDIDTDVVDANGDDTAKVSLFVYDNRYNPQGGVPVYFASSRGTTDIFVEVEGFELVGATEEFVPVSVTQKVIENEGGTKTYGKAVAKDGTVIVDADGKQADLGDNWNVVVDSSNNKVTKAEKATGDKVVNARVVCVIADGNGKVEVEVKSMISGVAVIGAAFRGETEGDGKKLTLFNYLDGNKDITKDDIKFIDSDEVEFTAESASEIALHEVKVRDRKAAKDKDAFELIKDEKYTGYKENNDPDKDAEWNRANDLDYFEVSVKVTNSQGAPSADQQVTFSSNKTNCYFSDTRVNTDGSGIAKTKVYAKKAGTYEISFKSGSSKSESIWLVFDPAEVSKIILKSDNNRMLAKDDTHSWKFELQDNNGNRLDIKDGMDLEALVESVDAVDYPSNGDFKTKDWNFIADEDNDWLELESRKTFTKEGSYKYRITLNNGEYAEFKFEIRKQGEYTGLKLTYDQTSLAMKATSGSPTVTWVDANGVEKDADDKRFDNDGISFSASDYNKILNGEIDKATGVFTATDDSDYIGDLIITAFDSSNKLSDSFKITIGRELSGIQVEEPTDNIEVGKVAYVPVKFVDIEGNQVAFGDAETVEIENAYALSKPAGATVSVDEGPGFAKGLKEDGVATLEVESDKAGEAEIFVNIRTVSDRVDKDGKVTKNDLEKFYTTTFKVNFGEPKEVVEGAAKKVVMFIGSKGYTKDGEAKLTDVAPFIKDSRTFVAVRPVADAFGVTPENIGWNEATQTVTLVRDDMTVTIVIGSNDIEVVKDGVVSTVEADVPAFIADGRTVLPFRAVGDAFGVTTNWDEATQSVTYEQ